jgi:hydrogenase nickel incorporation protein HypA/HybF
VHEFSVAANLVDLAVAEARRVGAIRVTDVRCRIGELCHINGRMLADAFRIARENTLCAAAQLHIEKVPVRAACTMCRREFPVRNWKWRCPHCGRSGRFAGGGDDLELTSIEVEMNDENTGRAENPAAQRAGRL